MRAYCHAGPEEPAPDSDPGASLQLVGNWIADQVRNDIQVPPTNKRFWRNYYELA
jgi:hypothetical protein